MSSYFHSLCRDLREMPRPVWFLLAGQFVNRFGSFVFPFLTLFLTGRGLEPVNVALVLAAMGAGHFCGPIASGYLCDAIGRRNTIVVSLFGSSGTMLLLYFVHDPLLLTIVAAGHGFLSFLFGPATAALLTDLVPEEKRVTAFALIRLAINAGFAAGPAVAGLLYLRAPILIFLGDACTTMVFGFIAWRWLPHGLRTITGRATSARVAWRAWIEALTDMRRNGPYLQFLGVVLLIGIAFTQVFNVLVLTASAHGLEPSVYGLVMATNGLLIVFIELPLTRWFQRFNPRHVLAGGYALIGIGCMLFGQAETAPGFFLAMTVFTLGEICALPIGMAYSSGLAPAEFRGRYFGMRGMAWGCAGLFGSLGVWGYAHLGAYWWAFIGLLAVGAAAGILPEVRSSNRFSSVVPAVGSKVN